SVPGPLRVSRSLARQPSVLLRFPVHGVTGRDGVPGGVPVMSDPPAVPPPRFRASAPPPERRPRQAGARRRRRRVLRRVSGTGAPEPPVSRLPGAGFPADLATLVSLLAALLFYAGAVHTRAYFEYFHIDVLALGLSFAEFVMRSLHLVTAPVVLTAVVAVVVLRDPQLPSRSLSRLLPPALIGRLRRVVRGLARLHLLVLGVAVAMLFCWSRIQPYGWLVPVLLAVGILCGQPPAAGDGSRPGGIRARGAPLTAVGLCLLWAVALAAHERGLRDAERDADHLVGRTAVVVFSTDRLSMTGRGLKVKDLGRQMHYRYRYTGLRVVIERGGRYYAVPTGWRHDTDSTYVLRESDDVRIELMPGAR
ncbi:hypothetical protein ACSNOJ_25305, partial [Streptomyces sp. URMC 128]|uniref:hypothetical protein n=1 Tax=Streptomyces sp. URMC 128 TaxID=3423404 RepID=UPI003F1930A5